MPFLPPADPFPPPSGKGKMRWPEISFSRPDESSKTRSDRELGAALGQRAMISMLKLVAAKAPSFFPVMVVVCSGGRCQWLRGVAAVCFARGRLTSTTNNTSGARSGGTKPPRCGNHGVGAAPWVNCSCSSLFSHPQLFGRKIVGGAVTYCYLHLRGVDLSLHLC